MSWRFLFYSCWVALCLIGAAAQAAKTEVKSEAAELKTRIFHKVPPDLLSITEEVDQDAVAADPFATTPPRKRKPGEPVPLIKSARDKLVEVGVTFPDGASASFDSYSGTLTVVNTQANLDLCEAYFDSSGLHYPHHVSFVLTVVEGPGEIIREASAAVAQEDAASALAGLMQQAATAEPQVRVVQDAYLETKSGTRATTRSVKEHACPIFSMDDQGHLSSDHEMRSIGLNLEMEPSIGADGKTIDLSYTLELSPAPPQERKMTSADPTTGSPVEFPFVAVPMLRLVAEATVQAGSTRLLGVVSPYGKAGAGRRDVQWAAFLTTNIVKVDKASRVRPRLPEAELQVPSGMRRLALSVTPGLLENECLKSGQTLQPYFDTHGILPVAGAAAVIHEEVLTVVNTQENIERIVALVDYLTLKLPRTVALTLHSVRGSGAFLRSLAAQAAAQYDHDAQWRQVQQALDAGLHDLRRVGTSRMETKSGARAKLEAVQEYSFLSHYGQDKAGRMAAQFETSRAGAILEFEPTLNSWDDSMELNLSHEFHPLPPEVAHVVMLSPGAKKRQSFPIMHAHAQQTVTGWHVKNGSTRLFALLKPPGEEAAGDELIATFLHCDVMPQSARIKPNGPTLEQMLATVAKVESQEQFVRSFRVSPDFISGSENESVHDQITDRSKHKSVQEILVEHGISFPQGAWARSGGAASQITVRNTAENLDKVQKCVEWIERETALARVVVTSQVVEAPGPLVQRLMAETAGRCDHRREMQQVLEAVHQGSARHLGLSRIETMAGAKGKAEQGVQHPYFTGAVENDARLVGSCTEVEAAGRAGDCVVSLVLNSEFHTADPHEHKEEVIDTAGRRLELTLTDFYLMQLSAETVVPDGCARMLAVWKPLGKQDAENADVLQVLFITCDQVRGRE
ncbi:hypothetical protein [Prosthecobacter vanneervenii]|uniref:Uncharacterized protein n=1 Tax=Prosthecobacter vanneervenii TaxID=48466 RepID=A0A7W7Y6Z2_9BACT|nr:hypothetical protein [Prosthecobacter vanneervenii]MBB5030582.1 hypothetical protein [Prosthecobacter vanneervenii]